VPSISQNAFNEIVSATSLCDGKWLKLSDIDVEFISCNAGVKRQSLNPERWLVRYQLMEIFARIALSKYLKPKRVKTESEALQKLFDEGLWEYLQSFDSQQWKKDRLYNFECSACLNENYDQLMKLFKKYRGKKPLMNYRKIL